MWSVPSGRLEKDEGILAAVVREAKEEVGVDIKIKDLATPLFMHYRDQNGERIYVFFFCEKWLGEAKNLEKEKCEKIEWFDIDNFPKDFLPHIKEAFLKMSRGESYIEYGFKI